MSSLFLYDHLTLAFWSPGPAEMLVLAVVALLLYGGNLPEVARSWGKSFAEFRRGLSGFQSELNEVIYSQPEQIAYQDQSYRDDSRNADGYEEADDYQDESESPEGKSDNEDKRDNDSESESNNDINESKQAVKDVGADTIVINYNEENSEDYNEENSEEKPAEEKFTD